MSIFKINLQNVIAFAICLILPIMGILSNEDIIDQQKYRLALIWPVLSGLVYLLWNILWRVSQIRSKYRYGWMLFTYIVFIGFMALIALSMDIEYNIRQIVRGSFAIFLVLLIQYALRAQADIASLRLEKEQYKSEEYKSQLKLLQAKVDPHFLFNSLNTLRSMVSYGHKNSVAFIINLSNFYRQNMNYVEASSVSVAQELKILQAYLFLMKCRYEYAVVVDIQIDDAMLEKTLPTMSLQVLVENCFKHNSMTASSPLYITIGSTQEAYIVVKNNLQRKLEQSESEGYGLQSLAKRYQLSLIANGVLINKSEHFFEVKIKTY